MLYLAGALRYVLGKTVELVEVLVYFSVVPLATYDWLAHFLELLELGQLRKHLMLFSEAVVLLGEFFKLAGEVFLLSILSFFDSVSDTLLVQRLCEVDFSAVGSLVLLIALRSDAGLLVPGLQLPLGGCELFP